MKTFDASWRLGLERMYPLLAKLGHPEQGLRIIQVAGTNGKGSTSYLTSAILSVLKQDAVGLYTSPHLERLTERFVLVRSGQREEASKEEVARVLERVWQAAQSLPSELGSLTEFEAWTLAAVLLFAEKGITEAVFEVGLGGRLDATTALPAEVGVITPISYDHQDRLGSDLTSIAGEKAAIIRPGQKVIIGEQEPESWRVLETYAQRADARLIPVSGRYRANSFAPSGTVFEWLSANGQWHTFKLGLLGAYQVANAASALTAVQEYTGISFEDTSAIRLVREALLKAAWPGRFELIKYGRQPLILDVGHNPQGIQGFLENLELYFPDQPKWGVFANLKDKDYTTSLNLLASSAFKGFVFTEPWSERRLAVADLAQAFKGSQEVISEPDLTLAVEKGLAKAAEDSAVLAIFGSFFLVGPARSLLTRS